MQLVERINSALRRAFIEAQRWKDHTYRALTGQPRLKRSRITENLFLGGQYRLRGLGWLTQQGITAVVNMRLNSIHREAKIEGMNYLHLPTPDQTPPKLEDLKRGAEFIQTEIAKGGKVYIHCRAGEGRGPSMALAYLISTGITLDDALGIIRGVRTFIRPTSAQLQRLKEFETIYKPKL